MKPRFRPPAAVIRKYFLASPDPERLTLAESQIASANKRIAELDRRLLEAKSDVTSAATRVTSRENDLVALKSGSGFALVFAVLVACIAANTGFSFVTNISVLLFLAAIAGGVAILALSGGRSDLATKKQKAIDIAEKLSRDRENVIWERERGFAAKEKYEEEFEKAEPKPTDGEVDRIYAADRLRVRERALVALGLTAQELVKPRGTGNPAGLSFDRLVDEYDSDVSEPLVVWGPAYGSDYPTWGAVGDDRQKRYSRYAIMVICPTRSNLSFYECILDFFTGGLNEEQTHEYHYSDVVAVLTKTRPRANGRIPIQFERFREGQVISFDIERVFEIVVSSGDRTEVVIGMSSSQHEITEDGAVELTEFQNVLDAVRRMLREKKGGNPEH